MFNNSEIIAISECDVMYYYMSNIILLAMMTLRMKIAGENKIIGGY